MGRAARADLWHNRAALRTHRSRRRQVARDHRAQRHRRCRFRRRLRGEDRARPDAPPRRGKHAVRAAGPGMMSGTGWRSEEHTSELQSLMRISYAVFCLKKKNTQTRKSQKRTTIKKTNTKFTQLNEQAQSIKKNTKNDKQ